MLRILVCVLIPLLVIGEDGWDWKRLETEAAELQSSVEKRDEGGLIGAIDTILDHIPHDYTVLSRP